MNGYSSAFFKISKIQEEFFSLFFFPFRIVIIINNKSGPPKQVGDCLKIVIAGLMTTGLLSLNCHCRSNVPDSCVYMTSWHAPPASQFFKKLVPRVGSCHFALQMAPKQGFKPLLSNFTRRFLGYVPWHALR